VTITRLKKATPAATAGLRQRRAAQARERIVRWLFVLQQTRQRKKHFRA
jgi:hypothetical protein